MPCSSNAANVPTRCRCTKSADAPRGCSFLETKMKQSLTLDPYQFLSAVSLPFIRMEDRPEIPSDLLLTSNRIQIYNRTSVKVKQDYFE